MNKIVKNTLILTAITVVAGLLLGGRFNASRSPVTTALKSLIVIGLCINFS